MDTGLADTEYRELPELHIVPADDDEVCYQSFCDGEDPCSKCFTLAVISCDIEREALNIEDPCDRKNLLRTLLGSSAERASPEESLWIKVPN